MLFLPGCDKDGEEGSLTLSYIRVGAETINIDGEPISTVFAAQELLIAFNQSLAEQSIDESLAIIETQTMTAIPFTFQLANNNSVISVNLTQPLKSNTEYRIQLTKKLRGARGEIFDGKEIAFSTEKGELKILSMGINGVAVTPGVVTDVPQAIQIEINFSQAIDPQTITQSSVSVTGKASATLQYAFSNNNTTLTITATTSLSHLERYELRLTSAVQGSNEESFDGFTQVFYTAVDPTPKFALISDEALLTKVQEQTFKYFWDFAHPVSGMARERNTSGEIVTSGGSGFGIMSLIVGIERNFITRQQGIERLDKILDFLEIADRFHGAWSHWINGTTGKVVPFSPNDNGGDLVETSFLIQGLLTMRQYLNASDPTEQILITRINALWNAVEWDWYAQGGQNVLYWHWSPDKAWIMNHQIKGYNEALITYVLAAASTTHSINASVYHQGWASNGSIKNGKTFYNITLPLGFDYGGPLFFAHYSFLGLDPRNLSDTYGNYWTQNVNHSKINHAYVVTNPKNFVAYSDENWGLTASDNQSGYSAHSPTNDLGVISPTAALSSFPYTPVESMKALKFFYYTIGDKLWGQYGFYDAFNITEGWTASSYLAIDQGPIIIMIENYRTGLLWDLFMTSPEVQAGLDKLSFSY
jgi:hypothetical protein